jgi:Na+/H+ antiporter NhaD/arsenite permease-like protein
MMTGLIILFIVGYCLIIFERNLNVDKAAFSLLTGVACWVYYMFYSGVDVEVANEQLTHSLGDISGILFFLLAAMTIVELIDAHNGFDIITQLVKTTNKRKLLWIIGFIAFIASAVLDNLTTAIVMTALTQKIFTEKKDRWLMLGIIVIAANAGGAWSPIGDVTTTMLWLGKKISAVGIMKATLLPSLLCLIAPLCVVSIFFKGNIVKSTTVESINYSTKERNVVFAFGILSLLMVPVFKQLTHLPPYMGILSGLGLLWIVTEFIHRKTDEEAKGKFSVVSAIQKTDVKSILFFLGILIAIKPLELTGVLGGMANGLNSFFDGNQNGVVFSIGLMSAIVDNVPLVAAGMSMYDFPIDSSFWHFLAYASGTGGSCLIIGSAAGVAVMGLEEISFGWYFKRISLLALIGYVTGALLFFV